MQYKRRFRTSLGLNLTPLIDIIFLLLVFFMLTAHFVEEQVIDIELPNAEQTRAPDELDIVEIVLNSDGTITINDHTAELEELEQLIRVALIAPESKTVRIRGDKAVNLGLTVSVMDAARKAGAESLNIVTEKP